MPSRAAVAVVLALAFAAPARGGPPLDPASLEPRLDPVRDALMLEPPKPRYRWERRWTPVLVHGGLVMAAVGWLIPALYGALIHDGTWAIPIVGPGFAWSRPSRACAGGDDIACPMFAGFGAIFASIFWGAELVGVALVFAGQFYFPKVRVPITISSTGKSAALTIRF
jgi:hypothetical protein